MQSLLKYRVYGLTLATRVELPLRRCELSRTPVDYRIDFSGAQTTMSAQFECSQRTYVSRNVVNGEPAVAVWSADRGSTLVFRFHDGIEFLIDRERGVIRCDCDDDHQLEAARHHLVFSLMGFLLASRHILALHGAAMRVGENVVALLGRPRSGKSIAAVELAARGADILTDELIAIHATAGVCEVSRGFPWVSVRTEAEGLVPRDVGPLGSPWPYLDDSYRRWDLPKLAASRDTAEQLSLICILSPQVGGDPSVEEVSPREACTAMLEAAARTHIPFPGLATRELDRAATLASTIPTYRLRYQIPHGGLMRALDMALGAIPFSERSTSC